MMGRQPSVDPVGLLGAVVTDVAEQGADALARIRVKHCLCRIALPVNDETREALLEGLEDVTEPPWPAVRSALEAVTAECDRRLPSER
jgi:hypothetical protein